MHNICKKAIRASCETANILVFLLPLRVNIPSILLPLFEKEVFCVLSFIAFSELEVGIIMFLFIHKARLLLLKKRRLFPVPVIHHYLIAFIV